MYITFLISGNDVISLESRPLNFRLFICAYNLRPQTLFPVVANTPTKSIQKQIKSIDVDKVGSKKKALQRHSVTPGWRLDQEMRTGD